MAKEDTPTADKTAVKPELTADQLEEKLKGETIKPEDSVKQIDDHIAALDKLAAELEVQDALDLENKKKAEEKKAKLSAEIVA